METTTPNDMEKLNESNVSLWKLQMEDILILRDQYFPIEGITKKLSSMTNEDWLELDRKSIATIRQCLVKNVYLNVVREKTT
jgi:hypothetical protein